MPVSLVPPIGAGGIWGVSAPFTSKVRSDLTYTCVAIRRLSEFRLLGVDPFTQYYEPVGINTTRYETDLAQGDVCIITLQAANGELIFVPTTYVTSFPNPNGRKYTPVILAIDIGSIPDTLNLSAVKTDIADIVKGYLGIESVTITSIAVGNTVVVNQNDHNGIEAARLGRITVTKNLRTQLQEAQALNAALISRNRNLEDHIIANTP